MKVLIVDNSGFIRKVIANSVSYFPGVSVIEASNGEDAVITAVNSSPDVIFTGLVLNGIDGIKAIKMIKKSGSNAKIIVCTSDDDRGKLEEALNAGASGFVMKPLDDNGFKKISEIISKVQKL